NLAVGVPGARLVAVADRVPEARQRAAAELGCQRTLADPLAAATDDGVDAVVIASPTFTHAAAAGAAPQAGKDVLCAKPLAPPRRRARWPRSSPASPSSARSRWPPPWRRHGGSRLPPTGRAVRWRWGSCAASTPASPAPPSASGRGTSAPRGLSARRDVGPPRRGGGRAPRAAPGA